MVIILGYGTDDLRLITRKTEASWESKKIVYDQPRNLARQINIQLLYPINPLIMKTITCLISPLFLVVSILIAEDLSKPRSWTSTAGTKLEAGTRKPCMQALGVGPYLVPKLRLCSDFS